jgi:phage repressor protein C with HTH and peptisase S24 domain
MKKNFRPRRSRDPGQIQSFAERLRQVIAVTQVSQVQLREILGGFSQPMMSRLVNGQMQAVPIDAAVKLSEWADDSGINILWLFTGEGKMRKEEQAAAENRRRGYTTVPAEDVPTSPDWHEHYVPIIGRVAAGLGEDTCEATEYPPAWAGEFLCYDGGPATAVAVRVTGQSMEPRYRDGDMVIVDTGQPAASGEICCVLIDRDGIREARLKRLKISGPWAILESINSEHGPERLSAHRIVRAYRVVDHVPLIVAEKEGEQ